MKPIENLHVDQKYHFSENLIDVDEAKKPEQKFVQFFGDDYKQNPPGFEYPDDVQFKHTGMNQFRSSSLECDEITNEAKLKSLRRMLISLGKYIDEQINLELTSKKLELEKKYNKKYDIPRLMEKAYHLQKKVILSNLGTGKLEEKLNETQP